MSKEYRYEIKFILNEVSLTTALNWIYNHTNLQKKYQGRHVNSLYFDDLEFQSVRDNLAGISNRQKMRLRWYRNLNQIDGLVLEYKNRHGRLGYKNKIIIQEKKNILDLPITKLSLNIADILASKVLPMHFPDTFSTATLHTEYYREYFEDYRGLRLTFDRDITFKQVMLHASLNDMCTASYPSVIMELKFPQELKLYVAHLLKNLPLTPKRHSKYLAGLATFGIVSYT
ncbi:MAG: VTC domain-containing protein [Candidatus Electrothrix sp. AS4_5]|nr:VTC domain-containing protein [Candidatus Electrothrix gigas]